MTFPGESPTPGPARSPPGPSRANGVASVVAVSHAYHLPRVRLEFDRAGLAAFTVPARETRILAKMPWFAAREVAGWWAAWAVRPGSGA